MCGFAVLSRRAAAPGAATTADASDDPPVHPAVDAALARRGPDHAAHHLEPGLVVVSSRLTHWEEGAATQPLRTPGGGLAVFNGELFNLCELRRLLGRPDASEIEILFHGLHERGPAFLTEVDGQFAVVVRFRAGDRLLAARDRFGVCPLYLAAGDEEAVVGSTLEAVTALSGRGFELDPAGLGAVLDDWAPTRGLTPFTGVTQCPPGEFLVLDGGTVTERGRWSAPAPRREHLGLPADPLGETALADLEARLRAAVGDRLRSTTPVACLLSGGIDSTLIGALARRQGARTGLGLYLDGDDTVRDRQLQVADALGMDLLHHRLRPTAAVSLLEEYVRTRRVPLVRLGPVGMMSLAKRARAEGIRAVLSGEGADELFCGYDSYRIIAARAGQFGPAGSLPWEEFGEPEFGADRGPRWARSYWRAIIALSASAGSRRADIMTPVAGLLRPGAFRRAAEANVRADAPSPRSTIAARREEDLEVLLGSYLLTVQGDHAWMEEAVELRPPYLSRSVAQWALAYDPTRFVSIGAGKLPVRRLLDRLAVDRPELAGLGFAKAAFRVDASFLLGEPDAAARLRELLTRSPEAFLDRDGVVDRFDHAADTGACSEAESMLFLFAASLGVLADG